MEKNVAALRLAWREERAEETLYGPSGDRVAELGPFVARVSSWDGEGYVWCFGMERRQGADVWCVCRDAATYHATWQQAALACEAAVGALVMQMGRPLLRGDAECLGGGV